MLQVNGELVNGNSAQNSRINVNVVKNLSTIIKNEIVQSHEHYEKMARDILWFNMTFLNHSLLFNLVRQLEFSLLQMTLQVDEMLMGVQHSLSRKLPITIIGPGALYNILRNISVCLPDNYELIGGTKIENIYIYYEVIKVSIIGNSHGIKLILEFP
jgi:hypothetical protein